MKHKLLIFIIISVFCSFLNINTVNAADTLIYSCDFENESDKTAWTTNGKTTDNSFTVSVDSSVSAHSGSNCLKSTGRIKNWQGTALPVTDHVRNGKSYRFSTYVYQDSESPQPVTLKLLITTKSKKINSEKIISKTIEPNQWVLLEGQYIIPTNSTLISVCIDSTEVGFDYYLDDFSIFEIPESSKGDFSFEGTDFEGWESSDSCTIELSEQYSSEGKKSLYIKERASDSDGPYIKLDFLDKDNSYSFVSYIMYKGQNGTNVQKFELELTYTLDGNTKHKIISKKKIQNDIWSKLSGSFVIPENAQSILLTIRTSDNKISSDKPISFFIDNVQIANNNSMVKKRWIIIMSVVLSSCIFIGAMFFVFKFIIRVRKKNKEAIIQAITDSMTKAYNRNAYEDTIKYYDGHPHECEKLFVTVCDVNFLKYINDNFGHEQGDKAIIRCADILLSIVGKNGKVFRTGGDEFICFTNESISLKTQQAMISAARTEDSNPDGIPFSVAYGFSQFQKDLDVFPYDIKAIIERADAEMYQNKQAIKAQKPKYARK